MIDSGVRSKLGTAKAMASSFNFTFKGSFFMFDLSGLGRVEGDYTNYLLKTYFPQVTE
tara:strand:+ start:1423 stop:1596 length:174 start_codon:yes stop_codon:yes gene_type:complete